MLDASQAAVVSARPHTAHTVTALPGARAFRARRPGRAYRRRPDFASRSRSRPAPRRRHHPRRHDPRLRRQRCRGRLDLEGRLRGRRSRRGPVRAALRARHSQTGRCRCRRTPPHARHAGRDRRPGAFPYQALRGPNPPPAVLDPVARSPMPRSAPPPSARAMSCSNPPPAPACSPSWPSARSATGPPAHFI